MADEGAVTVCVRVRPLIERENADLDDKATISWKSEERTISQVDGTKSFTFDQVFHSEDSTAEVYTRVAAPIISSAVQGYNGTIFAYGQTSSGKTYTILGTKDCPGILPMAIDDVFKTICSRTIYVEDLSEELVTSPEQVMNWIQKGEKNRHYGETKMNERSSRSHAIFRMIIESKEKADTSSSNYEGAVMVSHLNLVDLAGSERASQTGAEGIRLKEGCNINRSLFILAQVIKKLSDDQSSGYISYRDSKLTRILQNSLGGNAKTVIICTVTPVSLEETLSTLQFASTAKKMKNSPKLNEVLDDDALLKRYRKEIEDLKRRLEEVSSHSHTREVEKDQLAQLLEEKNSLQKQQEDSIRALTERLVTASSFAQERELRARKKRRVTWAPGEMKKDEGIRFLEDFPDRAKKFKASVSSLPEMDESLWSEFSEGDDPCTVTSAAIPEEWIPGPEVTFTRKEFADSVQLCEMLAEEKDIAVNEWQAMKEKLESMQQENEELACELEELKERISTDEFVALEREATKDQEMQLIHEISSLKAVIANAELYNQDLQVDLQSKDLQLKEQEHEIHALEKRVTELKNLVEELANGKRDVSFSMDASNIAANEIHQMKQSLSDAEVIALDAKKESSFLRSENLALKEKLNQLSEAHSQLEKDAECYRRQWEDAKVSYKNMLCDMQKELQYYVQENTKLTSLLDGKVPKDLLSFVELEEELKEAKKELSKALEANIVLRKEVTALSEVGLKPDHESLQKEILEKSETVAALTSEKETLLSQVSEKERMLRELTEILKSKEDIANAEATRQNEATFQEAAHRFDELEQKFSTVSEEHQQMKDQLACLSDENLKLNATISDITQELSSKVKELQEKDLEQEKFLDMKEQLDQAYQKCSEVEQLKDQVKALESQVEASETEKLALAQRLRDGEEQIRALTEERNCLQEEREALERERDQIKEDIQETVSMNIGAQEELRTAHNSLKQSQIRIQELEQTILETESQISSVKETLGLTIDEQKQQILNLTEDLEQVNREKNLLLTGEAKEIMPEESGDVQLMQEQILSLQHEKTVLQQQLEVLQEDKDQCLEREQLLSLKMQELEREQAQLHRLKEQLCEAQEKQKDMEHLQEQCKARESELQAEQLAKLEMAERLRGGEEERTALTQERDYLKQQRDSLQTERDALGKLLEDATGKGNSSLLRVEINAELLGLSQIQQLEASSADLKQLLELREEQSRQDARRLSEMELLQAAGESRMKALQGERELLLEKVRSTAEDSTPAIQENETLRTRVEALQMERDNLSQTLHRLGKTVEKTVAANLELQGQLRSANCTLGEQNKLIEELKGKIKHQSSQASNISETLDQLKRKTEDTQEEMEKLHVTVKHQEEQIDRQKDLIVEKDELLQKLEAKFAEEVARLSETLEKLTQELSLQTGEKDLLLAEQRQQAASMQLLAEEKSLLQKEREDLQQAMETIRTENDQLQRNLSESTEKFSQTIAKLECALAEREQLNQATQETSSERREQDHMKCLEDKVSKIMFLFSRLCRKKGEYYANVGNYTKELLQEKRKQYELLTQIQPLKKEPRGALSEHLGILELNQSLDTYTEQVLKDVSEMEDQFLSIEAKVQQMENDRKEANWYLDRCSVRFDVQDVEAGIKQDNDCLWLLGHLLKPKSQDFAQGRSDLETKNENYCRETEAALKSCRERTKELLQELNTLKEQETPCGIANLALEEENYKLDNKLKAAEQYIKMCAYSKDLKLKMQELENAASEAGAHLQEKEKRIAILEREMKIRASKSEVVRLQATLEEKETCLRSALAEKQTLQAQLSKGAELYKEQIEDLKTQLAKADMARMKQSKYFDQEIANARAIAEYREDQLRKLQVELRRAQQEQDVSVISSGKDICQPSLPITCGGGSGVIQNTQVLVLKSEHAKLEKEYGQLHKQHDLLLKNERLLKEEVKKWKERALRWREQTLRTETKEAEEEHRLRSPRKTAPPSFPEVPPSPSKRCSSQLVAPLETPALLPLNYPRNFFDEPRLGTLPADRQPAGAESIENNSHQRTETRTKDEVAKCKAQ
ncbi:hypothetical protein lerEdw1_012333 [Lerista edwardsae]|nr:hypothetical protein lerEdw1_012333 [Lerista edwardsae]